MKKSFLSKLGKVVQNGLESADKAIDEGKDKMKDVLAGNDSTYICQDFVDMTEAAKELNELAASEDYKSFKVLGSAMNKDGGVDLLMFIVQK
jgi:hypothetical protein